MSKTITPYATNRYRYPTGPASRQVLKLYDRAGLYLEIVPHGASKHLIAISDPQSRSVRWYGFWTGAMQHSRCGVLFVRRRLRSCPLRSCAGPPRATSIFRGGTVALQPLTQTRSLIKYADK